MKRMKSMYVRQVAILLGLTFLCMVLLGVGFFTLSYRYQLQEIQTTLDRNAGFISSYADAALTKGGSLTDESFVNYIHSVVLLTDTTVLVCDTDGQVLCAAGSNLNQEAFNTPLQNLYVPNWAVNQLLRGSEYSGMTTFNQLLNSRCYLTSEVLSPLTQDPKDPADLVPSGMATGFLFVAADATSVSEFLHSTLQLFLITAMVVLLISLIICSITVQRMVDPLKGMCAFAHKFAHGEVDTRVTEYANRDDEIGELVSTINDMSVKIGQAEKTQTEFISSVSHELRTPLTAISGWGETLLTSENLDAETRRGVVIIAREAKRLTGMVEELLEFTRMQDGRFTLHVETADILAEFEDTVFMYGNRLKQEGICLHYDGCDEEIPEIPCDVARMRQVFLNILDNAAKHGGEGKRIDASIAHEGSFVVIRMRDYGPGIPEEELPHVKLKFYKGSSKARGSGIGLAVCEEIVTMHGGTLTLENAEGGGTLVTISIPTGEE